MRFSKVSHPQISRAISTTIRKKKEKQVSRMLSQNSQLQSLLRDKFGIQTNEVKMPPYSKIQNCQQRPMFIRKAPNVSQRELNAVYIKDYMQKNNLNYASILNQFGHQ